MSEIKALEELRGLPFHGTNGFGNCVTASKEEISSIADAIEREIAERFMELPADADGVPIHVGDRLELGSTHGCVISLTYSPENELPWEWQADSGDWYNTKFARHVKLRTLENVLEEFGDEVWNTACDTMGVTWSDSGLDASLGKYADEIREIMGVEE